MYRLSKVEIAVLRLPGGKKTKKAESAAQRGISGGTVRYHLKPQESDAIA